MLELVFFKVEMSSDLSGMIMNLGLSGMLGSKDYQCVDILFPFVVAFIGLATEWLQDSLISVTLTNYSEFAHNVNK